MNSILLICESNSDACYTVQNVDEIKYPINKIDILSMHPEIKHTFGKHNISTISCVDYINNEDYEIINSDCEKIYLALLENVKLNLACYGSKSVENMFTYYAFFAFYTIVWNYRLLVNILSKKQYCKVLTYGPGKNTQSSPWFFREHKILHMLLSQVLVKHSIDHVVLKKNDPLNVQLLSSTILNKFRQLMRPFYKLVLKMVSINLKKTCVVLVPTTGKNMHKICTNMTKKYKDILFFSLGGGRTVLSELYNLFILTKYLVLRKGAYDPNMQSRNVVKLSLSMLTTIEMEENSKISSISCNKLIIGMRESGIKLRIMDANETIKFFHKNKIHQIIDYIAYERCRSFGLKKILDICEKIDLIISQMSLGLTCELGYMAEKYGIPSMLISHGSHVLHSELISRYEHDIICNNILLGGYRYNGIQTALSREYALERKTPKKSIIKIKPIILSSNFKKTQRNDKKLNLLHAGSIKGFGNRNIYETPNELLETFQETIEILSTCKNINLIIKFREIEEFSLKALKKLLGKLPGNVSIFGGGRIEDYLASSDLLMSFSSTTIEEALINDTPVLLYGGKGRYAHIPANPYKLGDSNSILKTVTFVENKKTLTDYFKTLNNNFCEFIDHQFDFDRFKLKDSIEVVDWLEQNIIFKER